MTLVLVTWLARKSHTNCLKFRSKLSHFLTYLEFFGLKLISVMSGVQRSQFWSSKWPLSGLFSRSKAGNHSRLLFFSLKNWDFFLFSSRPVNTFNCQKSAFWIRTQGTSEFLAKNIIDFLRIRIPEFSSKFWLFLNYFQFLSNLKFKFWNVEVSKIEFLGSEYLNLVTN